METIRMLRQIISKKGYIEIPSRGLSMYPLLRTGTICRFAAFDPFKVRRGDILLFMNESATLVGHRYVRKLTTDTDKAHYICKGDSNAHFDPPVRPEQIIGIMKSFRIFGMDVGTDSLLARMWGTLMVTFPALSKVILMYSQLKQKGRAFLAHIPNPFRRIKVILEIGEIRKPLAVLYPYVIRHWEAYVLLILFMLIGIFGTLFFAWFTKNITDAAVFGNLGRVGELSLLGIGFLIVNGIVIYFNTYIETTTAQQIKMELKNDLYEHMLRLPARFYDNQHSGKLVSHLTNDINSIDGVISGSLLGILRLPLTALGAFIYLIHISWQLSVLCFLLAPTAAAAGAVFGKFIRKNSKLVQEYLGAINSFLNDSFTGHTVIRSFSLQRMMHGQYEEHTYRLYSLEITLAKLRGLFQAGTGFAGATTYFLGIGLGAYLISTGSMTVGALIAFMSLVQYVIQPFTGMAGLWGAFQRSLAAVERIQQVLSDPTEPMTFAPSQNVSPLKQGIEFRNVRFGYEAENEILHRFNLSIPVGKVTALVGPSGAGKSTLFHLLLGFDEPQDGHILFDGNPLSGLSLVELRSYTSYVPQETYLFTGTIRDNIAYGRLEATEEEIQQAAKAANAHEFIVALPDGYDTQLSERGAKLSGGQRQRIAIARAILKDAPILLLDEATSSLDSETENMVQEALERLMQHRTTIVITHRLSTIQNADMIAVIDQGRVVEQGKHCELIARNGLYTRLYQLQYDSMETEKTSQAHISGTI